MPLVIKLLGRFEVWREGELIENWPRQKTQELLKLLVSERGRSFSQDQLIEAFFPDLHPVRAVNNLQKRVGELRRVLEPNLTKGTDSQFILQAGSHEQGYYFSQEVSCHLDTEEFQTHLEAAHAAEQAERWAQVTEHYQRAVELYRGDFLADSLYEEWTIAPRERWKEKYLSALMRLAEAHARLGHFSSAIECCKKVLEKEAWNENVVRQKMLYLYHMGNQPKALDTFKTCIEALKKHLGVEPTVETRQLYEQILKHQVPPLPRAIPNNLPQQLTSFIGREREIEEVKRLLISVGAQHAAPLPRLVTLTGVGGCGKTRLGLQIGSQVLKEYSDGVWWVELASLVDPNLVVQAIASALGVKEQPGRPLLATITDYLHAKQVFLVLDNCEHLIEACAKAVQELLKACPKLQILVTSREPLGILGETIWQVPPLSVPDAQNLRSIGEDLVSVLQKYEAVNLFVERARANESKFRLSEYNARATTEICYQLDGIPLAIELAAARVRALSIEQIAARLDDRFKLLTGGNRAALPRHQTLQATMDWSYQLLSEKERVLLRRLSVFAGGWTLEAAEAVCADELILSQEVMELLTRLVDKSLVIVEKQGEDSRYKLLETVRQYSHDKLVNARDVELIRDRHLDFFLRFAKGAEPRLQEAEQTVWLNRLEREHDNMRTALAWSLENSEEKVKVETGLLLTGTFCRFWEVRGHFTEGRTWLESAFVRAPARTIARAKALNGAGNLAFHQGDFATARSHYHESLAIKQELGDKRGTAISLNNLGNVAYAQGDYVAARSFYQESLAIKQELGDKRSIGIAYCFGNIGVVARAQRDYEAARFFHQESLIIKRELGDKRGIASSLNNLGEVARAQGDYAAARSFYQESLAIKRELGDKRGIAGSLNNLGNVALAQEDYVSARSFHEESLAIQRELRDKQHIAECLEGLAGVACATGESERATQLLGAAESLRDATGAVLDSADQADYESTVATACAALGEDAFAKAWAEGRAMTLDQAIAYALQK